MNIGMYQGAAAMVGLERWQNTLAQNLASASVPGFKAEQGGFEAIATAAQRVGQSQSGEVISGVTVPQATAAADFSPGQVSATGNPMDVALMEEGFFSVQLPDGATLYTRNGEFHTNADGELVNHAGMPVLGEAGPIQVVPGQGPVSFNAQGEVFQGGANLGKLAVTRFQNPEALVRAGGGFLDPSGAAFGEPVLEPSMSQGFLESGNVNVIDEMVRMITISRAYEANTRAMQTQDEAVGRALTTFNTR